MNAQDDTPRRTTRPRVMERVESSKIHKHKTNFYKSNFTQNYGNEKSYKKGCKEGS